MPILEIQGNVETRYSRQQPFPGSLSSAFLVARAWEQGWVSKCKTLLGVFEGVLIIFFLYSQVNGEHEWWSLTIIVQ